MKITQLSVFVENAPGHVLAPCRVLANAGVNLRALSLADTKTFGILRMIVSDWRQGAKALEEAGFLVKATEVLAVEVPDRPAGLSQVLAALHGSSVNIEYMYAFPFGRGGKATLIFRFDKPDVAIANLQAAGISLISHSELE
ncbi:MAG: acetolactate synthase [Candidatus Korobacteraceae bacterium]|jgi:hypothetical protein